MIDVADAWSIICRHVRDYGVESVPLDRAIGRVLREDLRTDRALPPYDRVTMDGIALQHAAFAAGGRRFPVAGIAAAGAPQQSLHQPDTCLEVMTGAVLPDGTDTVIRYEDVDITDGVATVRVEELKYGKNVHRHGEDRTAGELIVASGTLLSAAEIGVAATVGKSNLSVARTPKVAIISTGDELVDLDQTPLPHQIRKSNVYRLQASLRAEGIAADRFHLVDDLETVKAELRHLLGTYDVLLLSGGVSKGKFDFLPQALSELDVQKGFHKIRQRPGKPFWFGTATNGTVVFALPGNPVSSFLCLQRYFLPWWRASLGLDKRPTVRAVLAENFSFMPDLTYFLQVRTRFDETGRLLAQPVTGNGSGDLANLVEADAFLELPRGQTDFPAGGVFPIYFFRKKM